MSSLFNMMEQKNSRDFQYDLISSPMMINRIVQKMLLPSIRSDTTPSQFASASGNSGSGSSGASSLLDNRRGYTDIQTDSRGQTRTATTILDKSLPVEEIQRYEEVIRLRNSTPIKEFGVSKSHSSQELASLREKEETTPLERFSRVSIYSGPLHNDRMSADQDEPTSVSVADRLANARIMQKSGYTWDQAGTCAKIRLGDGAILQNLYPSHSHVKLRNGKIERIDTYYQRMLKSEEVLTEISMIKDYEYNQWSRAKPLNLKDYESSKPIPLDKIESKCIQPSWYTMRPNNSLTALGAKNRLFSCEDLVSKFSQPKFLKRLGFIDDEMDYNPITFTLGDDEIDGISQQGPNSQEEHREQLNLAESFASEIRAPKSGLITDEVVEEEAVGSGSEELSSDDEEYHNESDILVNVPPERIPSSKRSNRQRLSMYKDDNVIGGKNGVTTDCKEEEHRLVQTTSRGRSSLTDTMESDKAMVPLPTVRLVDNLLGNQKKGANLTAETRYKAGSFHSKPLRKESYKLDFPVKLHHADRKHDKFSQPVCLCPKLSKETLNSFYAPSMQRYIAKHSYGWNKCQLHNSAKYSQSNREKIILKSL